MAWISVHEDVIGPKLREMAQLTGISKNEALGTLVTLWLWGIKNADQSGKIKAASKRDVADVICTGLSYGIDSVEVVENMIRARWIDEEEDGLYFHDWEDWQSLWYKYLREKERDTQRRREARQRARQAANVEPELGKEQPAGSDGEKPNKSRKPKKPEPEKKRYSEFVSMKEEEYQKLLDEYGEAATKKMVEVLNNYKGANGKTYKSDYLAILNWVKGRVQQEHPRLFKRKPAEMPGSGENPFKDWEGYERGED